MLIMLIKQCYSSSCSWNNWMAGIRHHGRSAGLLQKVCFSDKYHAYLLFIKIACFILVPLCRILPGKT